MIIETKNIRLREIDFLRGIAIILVLLRHQLLFDFTKNMGWIGVDLFFVLSGFLVSGLLFKEYLKFGNIKPCLFLIRRGFKIYPIYYLFYILYLIPIFYKKIFFLKGFLSDMFFVQNYVLGWGYSFRPSWSLAVEEHFYFGFGLLLWLGLQTKFIELNDGFRNKISRFEIVIITMMVTCIGIRIFNNLYSPEDAIRNFTMSHLRIDSLLAGVLVSYLYYFRNHLLIQFFNNKKKKLLFLSLFLVSYTPLFEKPEDSFFILTIGFTFLYVAFAILLTYFLVDETINTTINKIFSKPVVNFVSKIGFSSYSIYIIHSFVNYSVGMIDTYIFKHFFNHVFLFFITSIISVFAGIFMTNYIEKYFLSKREKYYPSRKV
jgi:peptidoglycan/LPS O-acetylase OafA/YrhL